MTAMFKDYFSEDSSKYGRYRPDYPAALYSHLATLSSQQLKAWDCATGNGQAALQLSECFAEVIATDASDAQIRNAVAKDNICYRIASAENSGIASDSINLITVAQAFHWFNIEAFSIEADRVLREGGILAIWTYNLLSISKGIDEIVNHLYRSTLGDFWPFERRMVENGYRDIRLPFKELDAPAFHMSSEWGLPQLIGYLGTWSAMKKYQHKTGNNPIEPLYNDIRDAWGEPDKLLPVHWPLSIRIWQKQGGRHQCN